MKLLIAGSRTLCPSVEEIDKHLAEWRKLFTKAGIPWWQEIDVLVSGGARGVDAHGEQWAREKGILIERHPADWKRWGRRAGYVRNRTMAESCALGLIFWDGKSAGTGNMIDLLGEVGRPARIVPMHPRGIQ